MGNDLPESGNDLTCVVAGHVDHGKSTLIGCLARQLHDAGIASGAMDVAVADPAFFTDCLQQERENRMTVDSAAVRFDLPFGRLTLVDVPGHAEFLHNMMTGATRATVGVLVVAVDEGRRPLTEAHARLMVFCGLQRIILVINKMDLADWSLGAFESARSRMEAFLAGIGIAVDATVPTSASTGVNVLLRGDTPAWSAGTLFDALQNEMARGVASTEEAVPRFVVQSQLRLTDLPPLCTGRVLGGKIALEDTLWHVSAGKELKVAGIHRFPARDRPAEPGESVALQLAGDIVPARGEVLEAVPGSTPMSSEFDAQIAWLGEGAAQSGLTIQWLYRTTPMRIHPHSSAPSAWQNRNGLLRFQNVALCVPIERPVLSFSVCRELGRFVLLRRGCFLGAGKVT
jgi:bifunctional enzyme CysN/CysC